MLSHYLNQVRNWFSQIFAKSTKRKMGKRVPRKETVRSVISQISSFGFKKSGHAQSAQRFSTPEPDNTTEKKDVLKCPEGRGSLNIKVVEVPYGNFHDKL